MPLNILNSKLIYIIIMFCWSYFSVSLWTVCGKKAVQQSNNMQLGLDWFIFSYRLLSPNLCGL